MRKRYSSVKNRVNNAKFKKRTPARYAAGAIKSQMGGIWTTSKVREIYASERDRITLGSENNNNDLDILPRKLRGTKFSKAFDERISGLRRLVALLEIRNLSKLHASHRRHMR